MMQLNAGASLDDAQPNGLVLWPKIVVKEALNYWFLLVSATSNAAIIGSKLGTVDLAELVPLNAGLYELFINWVLRNCNTHCVSRNLFVWIENEFLGILRNAFSK